MSDEKKTPKKKKHTSKGDSLTIKQRKWLVVYMDTGNATEAAMQIYDCENRETASVIGSENLVKLKGKFSDVMDMAGLSDEFLAMKLREGMDAEKVEIAKHQGKILDEKTYIDYPTRKSYIDLALRAKGRLKEHIVHEGAVPVEFTGDNPQEYINSKIDE